MLFNCLNYDAFTFLKVWGKMNQDCENKTKQNKVQIVPIMPVDKNSLQLWRKKFIYSHLILILKVGRLRRAHYTIIKYFKKSKILGFTSAEKNGPTIRKFYTLKHAVGWALWRQMSKPAGVFIPFPFNTFYKDDLSRTVSSLLLLTHCLLLILIMGLRTTSVL